MSLESNILRSDSVRCVPNGYEVDIRIAWYRSLPLSCVENIAITISDQEFNAKSLKVLVKGETYSLEELAAMTDEWWFVLDPLTVHIPCDTPVQSGVSVDLKVSLATRIPYIIIGPNFPLVQRADVSKEVVVQ